MHKFACLALAVAAASSFSPIARAAQGFDTCTGFIDALPATISTQGTWCLRNNLATSISSGDAITIATNNVTIDCNEYKLGGLGAGLSTNTAGIVAEGRVNITLRNCNIRGFRYGALLLGGSGHVVEDNRFESNRSIAIYTEAAATTLIRRNQVIETGGRDESDIVRAIVMQGGRDCVIADNIVSGVFAAPFTGGDSRAVAGIHARCDVGSDVLRNRISGLVPLGSGYADGIDVSGIIIRAEGNFIHYSGPGNPEGYAVYDQGNQAVSCRNNTLIGFGRQLSVDPPCTEEPSNTFVEPAPL